MINQVVRKNVHGFLGPGPSKQMGKTQDLESRVMLHDLLCHGETSITEEFAEGPQRHVHNLV